MAKYQSPAEKRLAERDAALKDAVNKGEKPFTILDTIHAPKSTSALATAALIPSAVIMAEGCKKIEKDAYVVETEPAQSSIAIGNFAVAYAPLKSLSQDALNTARLMDRVLIQPGYDSPEEAKAKGIHAMGYSCVFSLTPGSLSTTWLEAELGKIDGFLKDNAGNPVLWYGNKIFDIRRADVASLVKQDIVNRGTHYEKGTAVDQSDLAIYYDQEFPGFKKAAAAIEREAAKQVGLNVRVPILDPQGNQIKDQEGKPAFYYDRGVTILSGIQPTASNEVLDSAAHNDCSMILESRIYQTANNPNPQSTLDSITDGILRFAEPAAKLGRPYISITFLEPGEDNTYEGFERAAIRTTNYINALKARVEALGIKLKAEIEIVPCDANGLFDFTTPAMIDKAILYNRQLKNSQKLKDLGVAATELSPFNVNENGKLDVDYVRYVNAQKANASHVGRLEQSETIQHEQGPSLA